MRVPLTLALAGCVAIVACSTSPRWVGRDPVAADFPKSSNPLYAQADLIEIREVDSSVEISLQYTGPTNISKKPLYYPGMPALLRPETAVRLEKANGILKGQGYRLMVWDAWRPPSAQFKLWDASGHDDRFVANPHSKPSQHSCGTAVDVTLADASGKALAMPTIFDSFTPAASAYYDNPDPVIQERKKILQAAMAEAGFLLLPNEWWHFIDRNFQNYPDTISLEDIRP
ncbi:MAG: M15 family metallopeptidase [Verrucomicrobiaceae bacterium]